MVKQRQAQRALCGQVLEDVIHGALETSEAQRRLAGVGVNSTRRNVVLLAVSAAHHKALVSTSVPQALENAVAAVVGQDLVVVVHDDGGAAPALARQLSSHLAEAGIHATIGIGGAYTKPNGLRWSYFEARDAASHGLPVNEPERLSLTSLLLASEDVPLADMANESLSPLRTFDAAHGSELMTTLETYLNHNGSVAAVAEALTLHRNTVRYRLAQITELTGYDPSLTADRVQLWLALAVARLGARQAHLTTEQRGVTKRPINGPGRALSDPALQGLAGLLARFPVLGLGLGCELDLPGMEREEGRSHRLGQVRRRGQPGQQVPGHNTVVEVAEDRLLPVCGLDNFRSAVCHRPAPRTPPHAAAAWHPCGRRAGQSRAALRGGTAWPPWLRAAAAWPLCPPLCRPSCGPGLRPPAGPAAGR